jgi:hypothetical protein
MLLLCQLSYIPERTAGLEPATHSLKEVSDVFAPSISSLQSSRDQKRQRMGFFEREGTASFAPGVQ